MVFFFCVCANSLNRINSINSSTCLWKAYGKGGGGGGYAKNSLPKKCNKKKMLRGGKWRRSSGSLVYLDLIWFFSFWWFRSFSPLHPKFSGLNVLLPFGTRSEVECLKNVRALHCKWIAHLLVDILLDMRRRGRRRRRRRRRDRRRVQRWRNKLYSSHGSIHSFSFVSSLQSLLNDHSLID